MTLIFLCGDAYQFCAAMRTSDAQNHSPQCLPPLVSISQQVCKPVVGTKSSENAWSIGVYVVDANHGIAQQPQQDYWGEGYANNPGTKALNEEEHTDDSQGNTNNGPCKQRLIKIAGVVNVFAHCMYTYFVRHMNVRQSQEGQQSNAAHGMAVQSCLSQDEQ